MRIRTPADENRPLDLRNCSNCPNPCCSAVSCQHESIIGNRHCSQISSVAHPVYFDV